MTGIHKNRPRKATGDIDFAVLINDKSKYDELKEYLIREEGFTDYRENVFVVIYKNGMEVDLIPFGAVEDENRKVTVEGTGFTSINVDGFSEVYRDHLPLINIDGHSFKFCSLPGFVLLKLIAWDDRPETRRDDILDICYILKHFFDIHKEVIWEEHNDLFDDDRELINTACRVMGREIGRILLESAALSDRIVSILSVNSLKEKPGAMARIMREYFDNTLEECVQLVMELKTGIEEGLKGQASK